MYQSVSKAEAGGGSTAPTVYTLQVESLRFTAYCFFWFMCAFAAVVSTFTVAPTLGPCPLTEGAEPTYGMHCSVLMATFGFNNICVYWDYAPSREATALVYPLFEYSILAYVILDFLQMKNDHDNGLLKDGMYKTSKVLLWVKIVLIAWFRMIFVCSVFNDPIPFFGTEMPAVVAHTLGFFGMQFALILIAFENVAYAYYTDKEIFGMSASLSKILAAVYLVILALVTVLKISWASSIFIYGTPWIDAPWPHIFDRTWMLLVAFLPLPLSWHYSKTERPMVITVTNAPKEGGEDIVIS